MSVHSSLLADFKWTGQIYKKINNLQNVFQEKCIIIMEKVRGTWKIQKKGGKGSPFMGLSDSHTGTDPFPYWGLFEVLSSEY